MVQRPVIWSTNPRVSLVGHYFSGTPFPLVLPGSGATVPRGLDNKCAHAAIKREKRWKARKRKCLLLPPKNRICLRSRGSHKTTLACARTPLSRELGTSAGGSDIRVYCTLWTPGPPPQKTMTRSQQLTTEYKHKGEQHSNQNHHFFF